MDTHSTANQVDRRVFIGGYLAASNPNFIRKANIKNIVKMFADDKSYRGGYHRHPGVKYFVVAADDVSSYDMRNPSFEAVRFVLDAVRRGENVLVHCHAGISRSSTVVLLYLMMRYGADLHPALAQLRRIRPQVRPNDGFMEFLQATNIKLKKLRALRARTSLPARTSLTSPSTHSASPILMDATIAPAAVAEITTSMTTRAPHAVAATATGVSSLWLGGGSHAGDKGTYVEPVSPRWSFKE